jgi:hypothetical protein
MVATMESNYYERLRRELLVYKMMYIHQGKPLVLTHALSYP